MGISNIPVAPSGFGSVIPQPVPRSILTGMFHAQLANDTSFTLGVGTPVLDFHADAGETWLARYLLWVGSNAGVAAGIRITWALPDTNTVVRWQLLGQTSASPVTPLNGIGINGTSVGNPLINFDASAIDGYIQLDCTYFRIGASGIVSMRPFTISGAETYIIRQGSSVVAQRVAS